MVCYYTFPPDRFRKVTAPKVSGAWNLHKATLEDALDYFVLFSSMSSLIGQQGQANYTAGNNFLDSLASYRQAQGLPVLAVNFGPVIDAGFLTRTDRYAVFGEIAGITSDEAFKCLAILMKRGVAQGGVLRADWKAVVAMNPSGRVLKRIQDLISNSSEQLAKEGGGGVSQNAIAFTRT